VPSPLPTAVMKKLKYRPVSLEELRMLSEWTCAALGFVMSRKMAEHFVEHWWEVEGMQDIKMSRLAAQLAPIYYHQPSLVQHVGPRHDVARKERDGLGRGDAGAKASEHHADDDRGLPD